MAKKSGRVVSKKKSKQKRGQSSKAAAAAKAPLQPKKPYRLPNVWQLTRLAAQTLWRHKKIFFGLALVYGLLNLLLAQGLSSSTNINDLKQTLNHTFSGTGHIGSLISGLGVFVVLVGSSGGGSSQTAGSYQLFLGILTSLAIIWTLRQVLADKTVRIRDAYYRGTYPLIPFILVLLVIGIQLLPLLIGSTVYATVIAGGIAAHTVEKIGFAALFIVLALWSLYMIASSLIALYIVTLPDMTPFKALRSAKQLVAGRRWTVLRKILSLPVILLIAAAIVMIPVIVWITPLAQWVFFVLSMIGLVAVHAYMYTLYRELLNE